jgi:predicted adenylyl cyclase CyaB
MPRNIEIKAQLDSIDSLEPSVAALADGGPAAMQQDDTFFACPNGRLKLRELSDKQGQLIFYQRPDKSGPKESFYVIAPTEEPAKLREALTLAYGQNGRVRKHRKVYMVGNTRVHLDRVEGLGDFLEFEVVLADSDTPEAGMVIADDLLDRLNIPRSALVEGAYVDLIERQKKNNSA